MKKEILFYKSKKELRHLALSTPEYVLATLHTSASGLSEQQVLENQAVYGLNKITKSTKKSLGIRLREAFVNPFTSILFFLAVVSAITDIILP